MLSFFARSNSQSWLVVDICLRTNKCTYMYTQATSWPVPRPDRGRGVRREREGKQLIMHATHYIFGMKNFGRPINDHSWATMVKKTSIGWIPIIDWRQKTSIRSMVVIRKKILSLWIDKIGQKSDFFHRWSIPSVKLLKVLTDGSIPLL